MTIWFLLIALLASPAWAAGKWSDCSPTSGDMRTPTNLITSVGQKLCWDYTAAGDDSPAVTVQTSSVLICLNPDIGASSGGNATIMPQSCPSGLDDANDCFNTADAVLDGTPGSASAQNRCIRLSGTVRALAVGEPVGTARIIFRGE